MKATLITGAAFFVLAIVLALVQLWFAPWQAEVFLKLEITLGAFFVIAVAAWFVRKEFKDYKRQHTDARLDE